ncbi:MAG TPA: molecular chaperone GroEL [Acidobacteriaceae bacterium]|jgi:chaperonin GroEL
MPRQLLYREEARAALLRGMDQVAAAVGATLGPRGHTVVLARGGPNMGIPPLITKDGVTVATSISLPDPWENEGAKLLQEIARRTDAEAGDGTTATVVLAHALFREGVRQVTAGADPQSVERGMRAATAVVVEELKNIAQPIDQQDLAQISAIATIAANGDTELGSIIGEALHRGGIEGNFRLDQSPTTATTLTMSEGLQFDRGAVNPAFIADRRRMQTVFDSCNVLVTDRRLIGGKTIHPFLQMYVAKAPTIPLLIVAEDIEGEALQILAVNNGKSFSVCPVRTPGSGPGKKEEIEDIAIYTGAKYFSIARGEDIAGATIDDLGSADSVIVSPHRTVIIGGHGAPIRIETRKDELRTMLADTEIRDYDKARVELRLASLSARIAVIRLGSAVQSKLLEKRDRAQDSVNAARAALQEGIVPGGGTALIRCLPALTIAIEGMSGDERTGAQIVAKALTAPLHQLATNAGKSADVITEKVLDWGAFVLDGAVCDRRGEKYGYNAAADRFEDLVVAGIVDPVKVTRLALQNSAELAGLLLTSAALVVDLPEPPSSAPLPQPSLRG